MIVSWLEVLKKISMILLAILKNWHPIYGISFKVIRDKNKFITVLLMAKHYQIQGQLYIQGWKDWCNVTSAWKLSLPEMKYVFIIAANIGLSRQKACPSLIIFIPLNKS